MAGELPAGLKLRPLPPASRRNPAADICSAVPQTWQSTILVVSHDRNFLNAVVTDIIHLHSQRLDSYRGDYENFLKTKEDRLKNQQREYEAQLQYRQHIQVRTFHPEGLGTAGSIRLRRPADDPVCVSRFSSTGFGTTPTERLRCRAS